MKADFALSSDGRHEKMQKAWALVAKRNPVPTSILIVRTLFMRFPLIGNADDLALGDTPPLARVNLEIVHRH
jgi:hypothetical protein